MSYFDFAETIVTWLLETLYLSDFFYHHRLGRNLKKFVLNDSSAEFPLKSRQIVRIAFKESGLSDCLG